MADDEFNDGPETVEQIEAQMRRNRIAFARRWAQIKRNIAVKERRHTLGLADSDVDLRAPDDDDADLRATDDGDLDGEANDDGNVLELRFRTAGAVLQFADGTVAHVTNDGAADGDADGMKDNTTKSGA